MNRNDLEILKNRSVVLQKLLTSFFLEGFKYLKEPISKLNGPNEDILFRFSAEGDEALKFIALFGDVQRLCERGWLPQMGVIRDRYEDHQIRHIILSILKALKRYLEPHIVEQEMNELFEYIVRSFQLEVALVEIYEREVSGVQRQYNGQIKTIVEN